MNEDDKLKLKTAITIMLVQNPEGLTAGELAEMINKFPLGIRKSRNCLSPAEVAHVIRCWTGFTSRSIIGKDKEKGGRKCYYLK